jgi:hypothetical protein
MLSYSRSHLANHVLIGTLAAVVKQDRITTAEMLALIAEVDRRGTAENASELLTEASGKTRDQVELMVAARFPKSDVPASLTPLGAPSPAPVHEQSRNDAPTCATAPEPRSQVAANAESSLAPGRVAPEKSVPIEGSMVPPVAQHRMAPLSPGRFELRLTISQALHDKLKRAQQLLGHAVPSGDFAQVLERALDELIAKQEKRKFAATDKPRAIRRSSKNPRHIPAELRRVVSTRDKGQCTYVSVDGRRCEARTRLEYDHEVPLARGGKTCASNLRLRCRAHNQLEAERVFGAGFMEDKRARSASA